MVEVAESVRCVLFGQVEKMGGGYGPVVSMSSSGGGGFISPCFMSW